MFRIQWENRKHKWSVSNDGAHPCSVEKYKVPLQLAPAHISAELINILTTFKELLLSPLRPGEKLRDAWLLRNRGAAATGRSHGN